MRRFAIYLISILLISSTVYAGDVTSGKKMSDKIPHDPTVAVGQFDNGLTYYIKENREPENRAVLQIMIKAGSLDEQQDQWGLAHFIEHMCFNGTKSFPKNELIGYFESIGMEFGGDINAATNYDRTKYLIEVPTDNPKNIETGIKILKEYLRDVSFDPEELEKERGVILEEWRVRSGVQGRFRKDLFNYIGEGSIWADRYIIGDTNVILNAPRERFLDYYNDWYRPSNAAVVLVGDFDKSEMYGLLKKTFTSVENPSPQKPRRDISIPENKEIRVQRFTDKEWPGPAVFSWYAMYPKENPETFDAYREDLIHNMISFMLSSRFREYTQDEDCPVMQAFGGPGGFIANWDAFSLTAVAKEGKTSEAIEFAVGEAFRAKQHGFTQGELDRAKKVLMSSIEQTYNERDKMPSSALASEYMAHFLKNEPFPGIAAEKELFDKFIPEITVEDVNKVAAERIKTENSILSLSAHDEMSDLPSQKEIKNNFIAASRISYQPYQDNEIDKPLMANIPAPGKVVKEEKIDEIDAVKWTLSNGAEVYLKKTDFRNDEIVMKSFAEGGYSLASLDNLHNAEQAASIVNSSGLGAFDSDELQKVLTGKRANVFPYIDESTIGFNGRSNKEDLETFFKLLNMYFTAPRKDEEAFTLYKKNSVESFKASLNNPAKVLQDKLTLTLYDNHPRRRPDCLEDFENLDLDKAFRFYTERFDGADGFKFIFSGSLEIDKMREYVETYIASLPKGEVEVPADNKIRYAEGKKEETVYAGIDPKAQIFLIRTGRTNYNYDNVFRMSALSKLLSTRLREVIREDEGATYGVGTNVSPSYYPTESSSFFVSYTTNPERLDHMLDVTYKTIDEIKAGNFDEVNISKIKTQLNRRRETDMKKNSFWTSSIYNRLRYNQDFNIINKYDSYIEQIDKEYLTKAAQEFCDDKNNILLIQLPEDMKN